MPDKAPPHLQRQLRALAAALPLTTRDVDVGGRAWRICSADNEDAVLDAAEALSPFPYGLLLWESALALASYLAADPDLVAGRRVLELGAGVGLPGLVARSLGASVTQTDHQPEALLLARVNAALNGIEDIETFAKDWRKWDHAGKYDVVLGADILYERGVFFHLERVFAAAVAPDGLLLLSDPSRPQALELASSLESGGWSLRIDMTTIPRLGAASSLPAVEVAVLSGRRMPARRRI
jgi:predicted nicotinamide N-methyase